MDEEGGIFRLRCELHEDDRMFLGEIMARSKEDPFVVTDFLNENHTIVYASAAFREMTGFDAASMRNQSYIDLLRGPRTAESDIRKLRTALRKRKDCTLSMVSYGIDKTPFFNNFYVTILYAHPNLRHSGPMRVVRAFRGFRRERKEKKAMTGSPRDEWIPCYGLIFSCECQEANRDVIRNFGSSFRQSRASKHVPQANELLESWHEVSAKEQSSSMDGNLLILPVFQELEESLLRRSL
uniref:PAS domain-containing protein n=1 Tax=Compsopogon caeruleus TaxID=31354 RepID=A0A7S1XDT8_9RHOD